MEENIALDKMPSNPTAISANTDVELVGIGVGTVPATGVKLCPLCKSEIKLFFINFNEKILMCENTECEYPFGYEDLQFFKEQNELQSDEEVDSLNHYKLESTAQTSSMMSSAGWAEIDQINAALISETASFENIQHMTKTKEELQLMEKEKKIRKQLADLRTMSAELVTLEEEQREEDCRNKPQITNQKWLQKLKCMQDKSGIKLLKPEEAGLLRKEEPNLGLGELKIDINPGEGDTMSTITIQIHDSGQNDQSTNDGPASVNAT